MEIKKTNVSIAITGASGRMGRNLIKAIQTSKENVKLGAVLVRPGSDFVGMDVGKLININNTGIIIVDNLISVINSFDILIDFSHPKATIDYMMICLKHKKSMVIGTTGFDENDKKNIYNSAKKMKIVFSSNFSIGINLILKLLEITTKIMGNYSDIEIIESHHRNKLDAPSGTALAMGNTIANIMNWNLYDHAIYSRNNHTGIRNQKKIGFSSIRAGDIIGEHTAIFADLNERIEITHKASNRMIFAHGAIKASLWLKDKNYGLYSMRDVLNL